MRMLGAPGDCCVNTLPIVVASYNVAGCRVPT
jgi:hypothetical protein